MSQRRWGSGSGGGSEVFPGDILRNLEVVWEDDEDRSTSERDALGIGVLSDNKDIRLRDGDVGVMGLHHAIRDENNFRGTETGEGRSREGETGSKD
jgi:hypothetical protein